MKQFFFQITTFMLAALISSLLPACETQSKKKLKTNSSPTFMEQSHDNYQKGSFGYDLQFVKKYHPIIVLSSTDNQAQLITSAALQGRVLTSTFSGASGPSLGYINHDRIASDKIQPHLQAYGGEDRFWIGPQGGQYTIFFHPGDPFDFDHWFTPAPLDTAPFELVSQDKARVRYHKKMQLQNYSNNLFEVEVNREIRVIEKNELANLPGMNNLGESLKYVGFESKNTLVNAGKKSWTKAKGLLSIWILGMFPPSPTTTVVLPYQPGPEAKLGPVMQEYFVPILGKLPPDRLKVNTGHIYYKADGNYCSKIGLTPQRAKSYFGSYNPESKILTLIHYTLPEGESSYVNSAWEMQKEPYAGDAVNSYNDGTLDHKPTPQSTFYELESSSPAAALQPGQSITHVHRTFHFQGSEPELDALAKATLGVGLAEIQQQFNP